MKPKVAVIGAGLAGLSAAYYLRKKACVVIYDTENRIGGRALTSEAPRGEHGPQFVLATEKDITRIVRELKIKLIPAGSHWPGYYFRGRYVFGWHAAPRRAVKILFPPDSARRLIALFDRIKERRLPKTEKPLAQELIKKL